MGPNQHRHIISRYIHFGFGICGMAIGASQLGIIGFFVGFFVGALVGFVIASAIDAVIAPRR
jgi:hypothetical protein